MSTVRQHGALPPPCCSELNHGAHAKTVRIKSAIYVPSLRSVWATEPPSAVPAGVDSARRSISVTKTGRLSPKYLATFFKTERFAIRERRISAHALQDGFHHRAAGCGSAGSPHAVPNTSTWSHGSLTANRDPASHQRRMTRSARRLRPGATAVTSALRICLLSNADIPFFKTP